MCTWVQKCNYVGADLKIGLILKQAYELLLIIITNHVHIAYFTRYQQVISLKNVNILSMLALRTDL